MDQTTLVSSDISAGVQAVAVLDRAHLKPVVALLMHSSEEDDWRLVLSSPALDQSHPLRAYEKVAEAFAGRFISSLPQILVLPTRDPFIREFRRIFGKAKDVTGMRLGGQTIGNRFISNAFVLRVQ